MQGIVLTQMRLAESTFLADLLPNLDSYATMGGGPRQILAVASTRRHVMLVAQSFASLSESGAWTERKVYPGGRDGIQAEASSLSALVAVALPPRQLRKRSSSRQ